MLRLYYGIMWKSAYNLNPGQTPALIRRLIIFTVSMSLGCAVLNPLFTQVLGTTGPQQWFSLSWWGLSRFLMWQPLSFPFIMDMTPFGITIGDLITLGFQMYLLWIIGSPILERIGEGPFCRLYLFSSAIAGILTLFFIPYHTFYYLAGPSASMIALLTIWAMLYPKAELFLFFLIPVKGKWIVTLVLGALLLIALSQGAWINFLFFLTASCVSYLYGTLAWNLQSPFHQTYTFDRIMNNFGEQLRGWLPKIRKKKAQIFDFNKYQQKKEESDDAFVDRMLSKIAKHGESSLSWSEKQRLQKIAEKKAREKK